MKKMISNIPNMMTISRMILTILLNYFIFNQFNYGRNYTFVIIGLFTLICLSDFFDGKIARRLEVSSVIGAKLDVLADLFYIISSYLVLIKVSILPIWYLVFVSFKFIEFVATSRFIKAYNQSSEHPFIFDRIGRSVSAIFFLIPGIACILNSFSANSHSYIIHVLLYTTFLAGVYSSYERIKGCYAMARLSYKKVSPQIKN